MSSLKLTIDFSGRDHFSMWWQYHKYCLCVCAVCVTSVSWCKHVKLHKQSICSDVCISCQCTWMAPCCINTKQDPVWSELVANHVTHGYMHFCSCLILFSAAGWWLIYFIFGVHLPFESTGNPPSPSLGGHIVRRKWLKPGCDDKSVSVAGRVEAVTTCRDSLW